MSVGFSPPPSAFCPASIPKWRLKLPRPRRTREPRAFYTYGAESNTFKLAPPANLLVAGRDRPGFSILADGPAETEKFHFDPAAANPFLRARDAGNIAPSPRNMIPSRLS